MQSCLCQVFPFFLLWKVQSLNLAQEIFAVLQAELQTFDLAEVIDPSIRTVGDLVLNSCTSRAHPENTNMHEEIPP